MRRCALRDRRMGVLRGLRLGHALQGKPAMNPARVDFVTLRLFCAVAQTSSITKGASRCHLALSAASRRLADFEEAVGSPLLERSAQGVRLTPAGHVAMQHAMRLSQGFDLFGGELAEYAQGYRGHVRLWANMSALTEFLPEVLARFMLQHPEIKVEVAEQLSGDIARAGRWRGRHRCLRRRHAGRRLDGTALPDRRAGVDLRPGSRAGRA